MEALLGILAVLGIVGLMVLYSSAAWGWVLYKMWGWFIMPVFTMLPHINFIEALGLMLVISLFKNNPSSVKDEYIDNHKTLTYFLFGPWMTLLVAWFIKIVWM